MVEIVLVALCGAGTAGVLTWAAHRRGHCFAQAADGERRLPPLRIVVSAAPDEPGHPA